MPQLLTPTAERPLGIDAKGNKIMMHAERSRYRINVKKSSELKPIDIASIENKSGGNLMAEYQERVKEGKIDLKKDKQDSVIARSADEVGATKQTPRNKEIASPPAGARNDENRRRLQ